MKIIGHINLILAIILLTLKISNYKIPGDLIIGLILISLISAVIKPLITFIKE